MKVRQELSPAIWEEIERAPAVFIAWTPVGGQMYCGRHAAHELGQCIAADWRYIEIYEAGDDLDFDSHVDCPLCREEELAACIKEEELGACIKEGEG